MASEHVNRPLLEGVPVSLETVRENWGWDLDKNIVGVKIGDIFKTLPVKNMVRDGENRKCFNW